MIDTMNLFEFNWEARLGYRTQSDPYERDLSIGETRIQLEWESRSDLLIFKTTGDFLSDYLSYRDRRQNIKLETGEGRFDLRELNVLLTPIDFMDVKAGRQILTWGTGDLLFINDLFPKDWNSFFVGRNEEYLKAPSDAVKSAVYTELVNLDVVYTPRFDADRYIDGRRISYYNANLGRLAGRDAIVRPDVPDHWFDDNEVAVRIYKNIEGFELALYGYRGFWKSPAGQEQVAGPPPSFQAVFPELSVYGASLRGNVAAGIGNLETGYYLSEEDSGGKDPMVRNSEWRFLAGYEQELAQDLTMGLQYYLERMMDHAAYSRTLPATAKEADENRHVLTLRLTQLLMSQNLTLSFFSFYSPSDADAYLRPKVNYKVNDHVAFEVGANWFMGRDDHTFFGQFENNSNVYVAFRASF